jgi:hypothetical protein
MDVWKSENLKVLILFLFEPCFSEMTSSIEPALIDLSLANLSSIFTQINYDVHFMRHFYNVKEFFYNNLIIYMVGIPQVITRFFDKELYFEF